MCKHLLRSHFSPVALLLLLLLLSSKSYAQQGAMQPAYFSRSSGNFSFDTDIQAYLLAGRSYECTVLTRFFDAASSSFYVFDAVVDPESASVDVTPNGSLYPPVSTPSSISASDQNQLRVSFVAGTTGNYRFTLRDVLGRNSSNFTAVPSCRETTLFGSFNRFFAQVPIVELENKSSADIEVFIFIVNSGGTTIVDGQSAIAKAGTRTDVVFADLPGSDLGQVVITHRAPFGALSGTVSEYDFGPGGEITLKRERALKVAEKN